MFIEENFKKELLTWNDTEPIYKQFEHKCAVLTDLSGKVIIDPAHYQLQYELHARSLELYTNLQTELYKTLYEKYPDLEFGMAGRLKSPFSHYEKVIRKFIDLFSKDEFKSVEILDDYGMKIFLLSVSYNVDKISVDSEGIYIDSGTNEFRICNNDCFEFLYDGKNINIPVKDSQTNVSIENSVSYIYTTIDDVEIKLPLNEAIKYKRSNKEDLVDFCYEFQKDVESFYNSKGFETKKRKDYISRQKPSGYSARQCSFYSEEDSLGVECQIATYDMQKYNDWERTVGYKPAESKISNNSLNKLARFALTTKFGSGFQTYTMTDSECFEYTFGIPLKEYRKQMKPSLTFTDEKKEDTAR